MRRNHKWTTRILILFFMIGTSAFAGGEGTVEGVIKASETGEALAFVNVFIKNTNLGTTSDKEGHFRINFIPPGEYALVAKHIGHGVSKKIIFIAAHETVKVDFELIEAAILFSDVVITATQEEQDKSEVSATIGSISNVEILRTKPIHPAEILQRIPGVWVNTTSGEGHMTAIRQPLTTSAVYLFLEDGVPTRSTGFFNHNALYEINIPQAEGIEVIKGPGTALYGSDAIGGVINATTRRPAWNPEMSTSVEGGSHGFGRLLFTGTTGIGRSAIRVSANITRSDGWRDASGYDRQSGTLRWDLRVKENSRLKTVATFSIIDQEPAGSSSISEDDFKTNPKLNRTPVSFRDVKAFRVSTAFDRFSQTSHLNVTGYFRSNKMDMLPNWTLFFDPDIQRGKNISFGVTARHRSEFERLRSRLIFGINAEMSPGEREEQAISPTREDGIFTSFTLGEILYDYDVTFQQASPYVHGEISPTEKLRIDGGLRFDALKYDYTNNLDVIQTGRHRRPASTTIDYSHLSPKLGMTYGFSNNFNAFVSYRHAFRVPSERSVFRQGSTINTIDLEPIKADNYEVGVRSRVGEKLAVEVSVYSLVKNDDIITFRNDDGTQENLNAGKTWHRGVEVSVVTQPVRELNFRASVSIAKHTYEKWKPNPTLSFDDNEIEFAPREIINIVATYEPKFWKNSFFTLEWMRLGGYFLDPANENEYDGHNLLNFRASAPVLGSLRLYARLNNITDENYAERATFNAFRGVELAPGLPRSVYVGIEYDWNTAF